MLELARVTKPVAASDEILVRVEAAAVNPLDWHYLRGTPYIMRLMGAGIGTPADMRLGADFAGVVAAVGEQVETFRVGDRVFGGSSGAFAEYVAIGADSAVVKVPEGLSFEAAAATPVAGLTALQALRKAGELQPGQKVLVNGASGGVQLRMGGACEDNLFLQNPISLPGVNINSPSSGRPVDFRFCRIFRIPTKQPFALKTLRHYRFELYLISFSLILFGDLFFPEKVFNTWISPLLSLLALVAGYIILSVRKKTRLLFGGLFSIALLSQVMQLFGMGQEIQGVRVTHFMIFSAFFTLVTVMIILQVWKSRQVNQNLIFGVMGGYISLGLVAFFLLLGIEYAEPGSFHGLDPEASTLRKDLLYFTYITLMTIGYGDISPVGSLARKAAVLIGLWGQFYLVIITALVVGKYLTSEQGNKKGR